MSVINFLTRLPSIPNPTILHRFPSFPFSTFQHTQFHTTLENPSNEYSDKHLHRVLQQCIKAQTFEALRSFHALTITLGPFARQPIYFFNNVISLYVSFGDLHNAQKVFDEMRMRNGVSYNALISGYSCNDQVEAALEMFCDMRGCGFGPTQFTFGSILSCPSFDVERGCVMHGLMLKNGLFSGDPHGGTSLVGMYGRNGRVDEAIQAFHDMPQKSLVTWNSIICLLGSNGFVHESLSMFCKLIRAGYSLSGSTFVGLLSGFGAQEALDLGQQIHGVVVKNGLSYDILTLNALLDMYVKYLDFSLAERMFNEAPIRDVVTYNTLIGALAKRKMLGKGLELLLSLLMEAILPNGETYVGVINCCSNLQMPVFGEYIHAKITRNSFQNDVYVGSALVDFYGKCEKWDSAHSCFDEIHDKNVVSWNSLIVAFSSKSHTTSIPLLREMLRLAYTPNEFTFSAVLKSSSSIFEVKQLHSTIIRMGYLKNEYVITSLLTSYAKTGSLSDALLVPASMGTELSVVSSNAIAAIYSRGGQYYKSLQILSTVGEPDIISWNILISTCSHNGHHTEAFELFKHMLEHQIYPDDYTMVSILSSCCNTRSIASGSSVHGLLIKIKRNPDTFVLNVLLDMYAKCGCVEDSLKIFKATKDKNVISWTNMICALGNHGHGIQALDLFKEMEVLRIKLDGVLFNAVISACRHGGLVKEGMELFSRMQIKYGIEANMDHYHGVVDLLARNGHLKEAEKVIGSMPFPPNAVIWRSFLEGCKRWRTIEISAKSQH